MGFFSDILSGGGHLHKKIIPKELRKMGIKEIEPGGFDPAKQWLGFDINDASGQKAATRAFAQQQAASKAYGQNLFNQSANAPIPGGPPQASVGPQFPVNGPYGLLAMQLAQGEQPQPEEQQMTEPYGGLLATRYGGPNVRR